MPNELSQFIDRVTTDAVSTCYSRILDTIGRQPGFVVNMARIAEMDATIGNAAINRDHSWHNNLFGPSLNDLLTFEGVRLSIKFENIYRFEVSLPDVQTIRHNGSRRMKTALRRPYNQPENWNILYGERACIANNTPPTVDQFHAVIGFNTWEGLKSYKVSWHYAEDDVQKFAQAMRKQYEARQKMIKENKTREHYQVAYHARYIKEVWNPRQEWWNKLTDEQRRRV